MRLVFLCFFLILHTCSRRIIAIDLFTLFLSFPWKRNLIKQVLIFGLDLLYGLYKYDFFSIVKTTLSD
jgi:hypothetical protein